MFENIRQENALRLTEISLRIAESIGKKNEFWDSLLNNFQRPEACNESAEDIIRTYISVTLKRLKASKAITKLDSLLLDESTWSDLGLVSLDSESIGQEFSQDLRGQLLDLLNIHSVNWLNNLSLSLQTEITNETGFGYGYGYASGGLNYWDVIQTDEI